MSSVNSWREMRIRDLFETSTPGDWGLDGTPEDGIPVLRSTNFRNDGWIDFSDLAYRKIDERRLFKRRVVKNSVLIEKSGGSPTQPAGRVVYCSQDFGGTASNFIEVVKIKDAYCSRYIAFLLYFFYQSGLVLKYQQQTTGIINFKINEYVDEKVSVPAAKFEQTKIAEILSMVDKAIEQTEALIAKQQRIKTGLMQDLLTHGIDADGNLRTEQTHEFKNSPLGRIPVEWEVCSLDSVANFVTRGSRGWARYYATEGSLFLRIGNLTRQHINMRLDDLVRVKPPELSEGNRTAVDTDDLLISITADLGIIAVIPEGFESAYVNQHIALVRLVKSEVAPRFVGWFLSSRSGQTQFEKLNESGAKAGLNLGTIKQLKIPKMEIAEQSRIAAILDDATQKSANFSQRLTKLRALKTALMQDLLTGRKRVTALLADPPVPV